MENLSNHDSFNCSGIYMFTLLVLIIGTTAFAMVYWIIIRQGKFFEPCCLILIFVNREVAKLSYKHHHKHQIIATMTMAIVSILILVFPLQSRAYLTSEKMQTLRDLSNHYPPPDIFLSIGHWHSCPTHPTRVT